LFLIIVGVIALFIAANVYFNQRTTRYFTSLFAQQRQLQVHILVNALEESIDRLLAQARVITSYSFAEYERGLRDRESIRRLFAEEQRAYGQVEAYAYFRQPGNAEMVSHQTDFGADEVMRAMQHWVSLYWYETGTRRAQGPPEEEPYVPPFYSSDELQLFGFLYPLVLEDEFKGVMVVALNLEDFITEYLLPTDPSSDTEQFVMDSSGRIIWSSSADLINTRAHESYPLLPQIPPGSAGSSRTGDSRAPTLIAWDSISLNSRELTFVSAVSPAGRLEVPGYISILRNGFLFLFLLLTALAGYYGLRLYAVRQRELLAAENEEQLRRRVDERTRELHSAMHRYKELFEGANDGILILQDDRITSCNRRAAELFGIPRDELKGMHPAGLSPALQQDGSSSAHRAKEHLEECRRRGSAMFEWVHRKRDDRDFYAEISLNSVELEEGPVIQAMVRDITPRKEVEIRLRRALEERGVMMKEIHHRVKNNLQLVDSILALESSAAESEETQTILQRVSRRILTISGVHETIYSRKDLSLIDAQGYLQTLGEELKSGYLGSPRTVELHLTAVDMSLETAMAVGFVVGEVMEHFYQGIQATEEGPAPPSSLTVELSPQNGEYTLEFRENPPGEVPRTVPPVGLGWEIVQIFAEQLKAAIETDRDRGLLRLRFTGSRISAGQKENEQAD
jgi:PAS domain S-box-containing protein